jgi:hypothetical protein
MAAIGRRGRGLRPILDDTSSLYSNHSEERDGSVVTRTVRNGDIRNGRDFTTDNSIHREHPGAFGGDSTFIVAKHSLPRMRSLDCGQSRMKSSARTAPTAWKSFVLIKRQNSQTVSAAEVLMAGA